jgi:hypothetical protein
MAGWNGLAGALIPLKGPAPTNFNFVSGDYDRTTGLIGDGTTKYLDSNRNNNADPQNSSHMAVYASQVGTGFAIGSGTASGANSVGAVATRNRNLTTDTYTMGAGFVGHSRSSSASYVIRTSGANATATRASQTPQDASVLVFRAASTYGTHRLAFYSIGESLDLALLDARVTTLINTLGAIP